MSSSHSVPLPRSRSHQHRLSTSKIPKVYASCFRLNYSTVLVARQVVTYWLHICGCSQRFLSSSSLLLESDSLIKPSRLACGFARMLIRYDHVGDHILVGVTIQDSSIRHLVVLTSTDVALIWCADVFVISSRVCSSGTAAGGEGSSCKCTLAFEGRERCLSAIGRRARLQLLCQNRFSNSSCRVRNDCRGFLLLCIRYLKHACRSVTSPQAWYPPECCVQHDLAEHDCKVTVAMECIAAMLQLLSSVGQRSASIAV